jgi:hypothetical protein
MVSPGILILQRVFFSATQFFNPTPSLLRALPSVFVFFKIHITSYLSLNIIWPVLHPRSSSSDWLPRFWAPALGYADFLPPLNSTDPRLFHFSPSKSHFYATALKQSCQLNNSKSHCSRKVYTLISPSWRLWLWSSAVKQHQHFWARNVWRMICVRVNTYNSTYWLRASWRENIRCIVIYT